MIWVNLFSRVLLDKGFMKQEIYDLIIIGAGPIGLAVAIEAKKNDLHYLILEKGMLVNTLFHFPVNMTFFSTSKLLEIGDVPFISHDEKPTRREALEYFRRVYESWKLNGHFYERVENVQKNDSGIFEVTSEKSNYRARNIVLSTGFYDFPNLMGIPGEDLPKVKHYYDEPHPYVGQKVAVIGAANSACDVALELYHKGAEVTMIVRGGKINDRVKYWIKPNIENRIKEGSINAFFNARILEIRRHTILIETEEGQKELDNDFVMAMTGYKPDFTFLERLGISCEGDELRHPSYNEDTHETSISGLYLAGVVCGGLETNRFFIENAREHADKIIGGILHSQK